MLDVDREQVLAYRIAAQNLHRTETNLADLAVFDLGVQDSQRDSITIALAARTRKPVTSAELFGDNRFTLAWTHRGAPHLHRSSGISETATTLIPLDDTDAQVRLTWDRRRIAKSGMVATQAMAVTARAVRETVRAPMTKGAVSKEVTKIIPAELSHWCRTCNATHVHEQLLRTTALPGSARLEFGTSPATLAPLDDAQDVPTGPDLSAMSRLVTNYLRLHGPAGAAEVAGFIATTRSTVLKVWPEQLTEVRVDGKSAFLPTKRIDELANPPQPRFVRLLPPLDPYLQARDRALLVPDHTRHKAVWKILGSPGVVLAGTDIVGTWRSKSMSKRLKLTVTPLRTFTKTERTEIDSEAERMATARCYAGVDVATE